MRTYYVPTTFRCLTDEQVGRMQHLMIDRKWSPARAAKKYRVSVSTAYRIRKAVPSDLIAVDIQWSKVA